MMPEEVAPLPDAQSPTQRFKESEESAKDVPKKRKNCHTWHDISAMSSAKQM